jgi:hypothetical protein
MHVTGPGLQDPGWRDVLPAALRRVLPFLGRRWMERSTTGVAPVVRVRATFLATTAVLLYLGAATLTVDVSAEDPELEPAWVWAGQLVMTAYGVGSILFFRRFAVRRAVEAHRDPSQTGQPEAATLLAGTYATSTAINLALLSAVAALSLVAVFVGADTLHGVVGFGIVAVLAAIIAPTARRITADDRRLQTAGVQVSLREALFTPAPPAPGPR